MLSSMRAIGYTRVSTDKQADRGVSLEAQARTLGYVRRGEHLFIVKDIPQWRRRQHSTRHAASRGHGR